ncbi:MAG: hypothetical protein HKN85_09895, partial [Gammaproteobacteria bacterium]|nr:hypothetical protein [Gammaproteobacteria bacterium]
MKNEKQIIGDQLEDQFADVDELDSLYDADDFGPPNELIDIPGELDDQSSTGIDTQRRQERFWMILIASAFALALVTSLVLVPMILVQQQRVEDTAKIIDKINLSSVSSAQALTDTGRYQPVKSNLVEIESAVNDLVSPSSLFGSLAGTLFRNGKYDSEVIRLWSNYKSQTDQFLSNEVVVTELKQQLSELND